MKVTKFDTLKGIYAFQLEEVDTQLHSHPAIEIISADSGNFTIETENTILKNRTFAIIDANQKHALIAERCVLKVLMIEHLDSFVKEFISKISINIEEGLYVSDDPRHYKSVIPELIRQTDESTQLINYDQRVIDIIEYINHNEVTYDSMVKSLQEVVHLSESRLSHLFKEAVGISLKKYLVWDKLKKTIKQHLKENQDLMMSLIRSGFYDQPHFSKAFKTMMGITPSKVYNSRTVQALQNSTP